MDAISVMLPLFAALAAAAIVWDHLLYQDVRDPRRRWRWRRTASADEQALRCRYCLQAIESRAGLTSARDRYLGLTLGLLHERCARELARTGRWRIRPAGDWLGMTVTVTAIWAAFFMVANVIAPQALQDFWVVLFLAYAGILSFRCVFYATVERRLPKDGRASAGGETGPPPSAPPASPVHQRTDLLEAMVTAATGLVLTFMFVPAAPPAFRTLERVEGMVARTWITEGGRRPRVLHFELRTARGMLHVQHNTEHSERPERQLRLPAGEPVTVWVAPRRLRGGRTIWQLEHDGQLLLTHEEVVAAQAVERVEIGALTGLFVAVGFALWLVRIFRPAPRPGSRALARG